MTSCKIVCKIHHWEPRDLEASPPAEPPDRCFCPMFSPHRTSNHMFRRHSISVGHVAHTRTRSYTQCASSTHSPSAVFFPWWPFLVGLSPVQLSFPRSPWRLALRPVWLVLISHLHVCFGLQSLILCWYVLYPNGVQLHQLVTLIGRYWYLTTQSLKLLVFWGPY